MTMEQRLSLDICNGMENRKNKIKFFGGIFIMLILFPLIKADSIQLNSDNLADDIEVYSAYTYDRAVQMKWDISEIPTNVVIDNATLCMYISGIVTGPDSVMEQVSRVNDQIWDESSSAATIWAQGLTNTASKSLSSNSAATWTCLDISEIINVDYGFGNTYSSIRLRDEDYSGQLTTVVNGVENKLGYYTNYFNLDSGEGTNTPYVNISYTSEGGSSPVVSLISPENNYINGSSDPALVTFNCSATDESGLVNLSLYLTDKNNENFELMRTANISGLNNLSSWTLNLVNGNYTWNCVAYNVLNESDWGNSNRTLKINYGLPVTLVLNSSYNLADISYNDASYYYGLQMKWNISEIPKNAVIKDASVCLYISTAGTEDDDANISRVDDQAWDETISVSGVGVQNLTNVSIDRIWSSVSVNSYACIDVSKQIETDHFLENDYSSLRISDIDYPVGTISSVGDSETDIRIGEWPNERYFRPREYSSNQPYLSITYDLLPSVNENWTISSNEVLDGVNHNLGTGKIVINEGGSLTLNGCSNFSASGLELNVVGDAVFVNSCSQLRLG